MPDDPKKVLQSTLRDLGFKHIVYVDDAIDRDEVDLDGMIVWLASEGNVGPSRGILDSQRVALDPEDEYFAEQFRLFAEYADNNQKLREIRQSIDKIIDRTAHGDEPDGDSRSATDRLIQNTLVGMLSGFDEPDFRPLGLVQWDLERPNLVEQAKTERTLFVFDQRLGEHHQTGTEIIGALHGELSESNAVFILLSFEVQHNEEHEETRRLRKEGLAITAVPKRSKGGVSNPEYFTLRLKAAVLAKESDPIRSAFRDAMARSAEAVADKIESLTGLEFDELFIRSSLKEGVHELDTLIRVYANGLAAELRSRLRGEGALHGALERVRQYSVPNEAKGATIGSKAWELYREELYESGEYINGCKAPLDAGDVFQFSSQGGQDIGMYILIAQPCDLMVRIDEENRKARELLLAKVIPSSAASSNAKKMFELPFFDETGKSWAVDFSLVYRVDAKLLDLCCLNNEGLAEVNPANAVMGLSPSWKRRWEHVLKQFCTDLQESIEAWDARTENERVIGNVLPLHVFLLSGNERIRSEVVERDGVKSVALGIKRIRRLSSLMAAEMLRGFGDYLSRPARPHALADPPRGS